MPLISMAPLLVISVSIAGLVYDEKVVRYLVASEMSKVVGSPRRQPDTDDFRERQSHTRWVGWRPG